MQSVLVRYRGLLFTLAAVFALMALIGWFITVGEPYLLYMKPAKDGATVQFVQRRDADTRLISPSFNVPVLISEELEVVLESRDTIVPNGTVEFADTTCLPGRFRIRFGDVELDVMEARIVENGNNRKWVPDVDTH